MTIPSRVTPLDAGFRRHGEIKPIHEAASSMKAARHGVVRDSTGAWAPEKKENINV
jgi:hypothetical protein